MGRRYRFELQSRSMTPAVWLLVFYSTVTGLTMEVGFSIPVALSTSAEKSCFTPAPEILINPVYLFILQNSLFCVLYPFTGWLSDVVIGRGKALGLSLWSCWFGTLLQCISYCVQYGNCGMLVNVAKYGISGVAFLFIMVGTAGMFTNIPAYGIDQLFDKPHTHSRAFVHWTVWGVFAGFLAGYIGFVPNSIYQSKLIQVTGLVIFFLTSIAVCLHSYYYNLYEPVNLLTQQNPYRLVYSVLRYAWLHKIPERRSALTFWENEIPSRVDLGKDKYGGPFTEGDIEDVKTFLRIMVIFLCTFGIFIPYYHTLAGVLPLVNKYSGATATLNGYSSFVLWKLCDSSVLLFVPVLQLIILPLFPKMEYFLAGQLRGFIFCYILNLLCLILMIILEMVKSQQTLINGSSSVSFIYFAFPLACSGTVSSLMLIFGLEFICSQAPSSMKGMLTGLYWFVRVFYNDLGAFLSFLSLDSVWLISSISWILVVQSGVSLLGLLLFTLATRWYTKRKRGDLYDIHQNIEIVYYRSFMQQRAEVSSSNSLV